jgi:ketosteroid isomerase-like protein
MSNRLTFAFLSMLSVAFLATHPQKSAPAQAPAQQASPKLEAEIRDAIRQHLAALRREDAKAYVAFFAEDCLLTSDGGARVKAEEIAKEWSDPLDVTVRPYGDVAVASYRLELDEDWSGQELRGATRLTDVFAHREGRWLLIAHQETPIPNSRRVAVQVDPALFDSYAGEYQLTPNYVVKVKRQGNKLMDLWPGDSDYVEDLAVDQKTFVVRGELGEIIYVRGADGAVTHFIERTADGDLIAKKTK